MRIAEMTLRKCDSLELYITPSIGSGSMVVRLRVVGILFELFVVTASTPSRLFPLQSNRRGTLSLSMTRTTTARWRDCLGSALLNVVHFCRRRLCEYANQSPFDTFEVGKPLESIIVVLCSYARKRRVNKATNTIDHQTAPPHMSAFSDEVVAIANSGKIITIITNNTYIRPSVRPFVLRFAIVCTL